MPASRVIVLTSFLDDERLLPAIQAGAAGYLLKDVEPSELARAIRGAHAGEAIIDPDGRRPAACRRSPERPRPAGDAASRSGSPAASARCWG